MSHYLTDNMLRSTKMTIYDFASGVTMHGFNHVFVKEMDVHTLVHSCFSPIARRPVVWTSPNIHDQGPINFENAYLDFGFSWIVRTFCASGKRAFFMHSLSLIKLSVHPG